MNKYNSLIIYVLLAFLATAQVVFYARTQKRMHRIEVQQLTNMKALYILIKGK